MTQDLENMKLCDTGVASSSDANTALRTERCPIAIIGIGCRFPEAQGPQAFWQLLCDGRDVITKVPASRFRIEDVYDPHPATPGKIVTSWGGFLPDIDRFDASFFGIVPREAGRIDPQQRLLLEVSWEALEDAGQVPDRLPSDQTGVFIGMCSNDYEDLAFRDLASLDIYNLIGGFRSTAAGRISFALGLQGPSIVVDTACASSAVAVHLACRSLLMKECRLALAGGANLILIPQAGIGFSQAKMLSPDGRCKFGDARADGFVRSEGVGLVVLKPLSEALADGDPIYAVIRGTAVNDDGRDGGSLMRPGQQGQEAVIRKAYRDANLSPGQVQYIEAHGTGTTVGDRIELDALGTVIAEGRAPDRPCRIGSVKTNIGHTEGAAGIAGLIKAALCLKHRAIPASLHFEQPNPDIPWQDLPLVVQKNFEPWPSRAAEPAIAGISSFGISGTNAHIVLQEAVRVEDDHTAPPDAPDRAYLLTLSARSPEALREMARRYVEFVAADMEGSTCTLRDLCYTASVRRTHHDHRLAAVFHSREELVEKLSAYVDGEARPGLCSGHGLQGGCSKLVFVFPGQGSQWLGMGRKLLAQEEVFRSTLEECGKAIRQQVNWSLMEVVTSDEWSSYLNNIDVVQPVLFAIQVALAAQWRAWGILPDAVVGHSMGEVAAAHVAGALSLEDAARIICCRSRLLKRLSGQGNMVVVDLSMEQAYQALNGYEGHISVAVSNSPTSTVLAGDPAALNEIVAGLQRRDIFCRQVKVDVASHSPQMEPLRGELLKALEALDSRAATLPLYSTVTGAPSAGIRFQADYWWENLREPVRFSAVVQQLLGSGHEIFLEISPHPILAGAIQQGIHHLGCRGFALPSMRRDEDERSVMLASLGAVYVQGYKVDWSKLYPSPGRVISLPAYPWQRERYWLESRQPKRHRPAGSSAAEYDGRAPSHPLLGHSLAVAPSSGTQRWEVEISGAQHSYLHDHRLEGVAVLPAAAYVEMALAAAKETFGVGTCVVEGIAFNKALFLPDDDVRTIQAVVAPEMPGAVSFKVFGLADEERAREESFWVLHTAGVIGLTSLGDSSTTPLQADSAHREIEEINRRCEATVESDLHYREMRERGLQYGASFQAVKQLRRREGEAIAQLRLPTNRESDLVFYQIHPVLLDASFQVMAAILPEATKESTYLPVSLERLKLYKAPGAEAWAHARLRDGAGTNECLVTGDISLLDEDGKILVEVEGLTLQKLDRDVRHSSEQYLTEWLYEVKWQAQERPARYSESQSFPSESPGGWLIFADGETAATLQSLLREQGNSCLLIYPGETFKKLEGGAYEIDPSVPAHYESVLREICNQGTPLRGVIHLWSLASSSEAALNDLEDTLTMGCGSVLYLVQALTRANWSNNAPRLWLVTRDTQAVEAQSDPLSIAQSPLWGLGRVTASEYPEFRCTMIDLSASYGSEDASNLFEELWSAGREDEVALRGAKRYVARLTRYSPQPSESVPKVAGVLPGDQPFRLEVSAAGTLEGLTLRAAVRRAPGAGEVELEVHAVGVNFRDVMSALGMMRALGIYTGLPDGPVELGKECAGKVVAIGAGVEGFTIGDEVVAIVDHGFATHAIANAHLVWRRPPYLGIEEAAAIPIAFGTASYALHHLGRMSSGERVLIHAASGGVGLAAVQLAKRAGAEIFATAGSEQKRDFLRSLGIRHVMDSRSMKFVNEVLRLTNGEGVDIVLNSLSGEAIPKSVSLLRPFGRFLEIGKRDIYQNANFNLGLLRNSLSFTAIDILQRWQRQPTFVGNLVREVFKAIEDGALQPLPVRVFQTGAIEDAFRFMAQANHTGKIVVSMRERNVLIESPVATTPLFREDGSYLITGGLGALGLTVARWMAERGARHLILIGRSGPAAAATETIASLKENGVKVVTANVDVANLEQVKQAVALSKAEMPPLRGVIHAAGILDDGTLLQQDIERFRSVMSPKVAGAWNLHLATSEEPLDFFVLFSSVASLLGSPGQGNYSAANNFIDALAHYRRRVGLPAMSINWGPWSEIGLAARPDRGGRLASRGIGSMAPERAIEVLQKLFVEHPTQVAVMPFDSARWRLFNPAAKRSSLLANLSNKMAETAAHAASQASGRAKTICDAALAAEPQERRALLETYLCEQLARVLGLSPVNLDVHQPLSRFGLDSLMAIEMKNRIELDLGILIPVARLLQGPSLAQVAEQLAGHLTASGGAQRMPNPTPDDPFKDLATSIDQMSDEEVESLLKSIMVEKEGSIE